MKEKVKDHVNTDRRYGAIPNYELFLQISLSVQQWHRLENINRLNAIIARQIKNIKNLFSAE